ncbi:MAG: CapA family protein [Bacteroidales bacterium]|nr:CapA family protein [Bacteroidales bacterium]
MTIKPLISFFTATALSLACATHASAQLRESLRQARNLFQKDTMTICVLGDMMMHTEQIDNAGRRDGEHNFDTYFKYIGGRIRSADLAIANMEFTLAGKPYTGYPSFSAPDSFARHLADCGFDVFLTANNHILDKGCQAAERTLKQYRHLGVRYCGTALDEEDMRRTTPLIIRAKGITVALINFTYGTNLGADKHWPKVNYMGNRTLIRTALEKADSADLTIVMPHWGNEYELQQSEEQKEMAQWLAENGADIIIGSHPHVAQPFEIISGKNVPVAYSLGNAVSNMSAPNTQVGLMTTITIVRHTDGDIEVMPLEFTYLWCSRPGGFCDSYTIIPIQDFIGSRERWIGRWEYDKMMTTYNRVKKIIKIEDINE